MNRMGLRVPHPLTCLGKGSFSTTILAGILCHPRQEWKETVFPGLERARFMEVQGWRVISFMEEHARNAAQGTAGLLLPRYLLECPIGRIQAGAGRQWVELFLEIWETRWNEYFPSWTTAEGELNPETPERPPSTLSTPPGIPSVPPAQGCGEGSRSGCQQETTRKDKYSPTHPWLGKKPAPNSSSCCQAFSHACQGTRQK